MKKHTSFFFAALAVLLVLGALFSNYQKNDQAPATVTTKVYRPNPISAKPGPAQPRNYTWLVGAVATYSSAVHYGLLPPDVALTPGRGAAGLAIDSRIHFRVSEVRPDTVTLAAIATNVVVQRGGRSEPAIAALLAGTPARITLDRDGALRQLAFPRTVPASDTQVLRMIYAWEFALRDETTWEAEEKPNFIAKYVRQPDGIITKTRVLAPAGPAITQKILSSDFRGEIGRFWLKEFCGVESSLLLLNEKPLFTSEAGVAMSLADEPDPDGIAALPSDAMLAEFTAEPGRDVQVGVMAGVKAAAKRERLIAIPLAERIRDLFARKTEKLAALTKARSELREYLKVIPEAVPELMLTLRNRGIDPRVSGMLVEALSSAGHAPAQEALAEIIRSKSIYSEATFQQAIVGAPTMEPNETVSRALWGILAEPRSLDSTAHDTALLNLARLAAKDEATRLRLTPVLEQHTAPQLFSDAEVAIALSAAANARIDTPRLREAAQNVLLSAENPSLRVAAVDFMAALGERATVLDRMNRDSAPEVIIASMHHLASPLQGGLREDEAKQLIALAARANVSDSVKENAIHLLAEQKAPSQ